jgi:hypothetical protein
MSLPANKRRAIVVDGLKYYWAMLYADERLTQILVHRARKDPGRQLKVKFTGQLRFTPHSVAFLIEHFLSEGWDPDAGGTLDVGLFASARVVRLYSQKYLSSSV